MRLSTLSTKVQHISSSIHGRPHEGLRHIGGSLYKWLAINGPVYGGDRPLASTQAGPNDTADQHISGPQCISGLARNRLSTEAAQHINGSVHIGGSALSGPAPKGPAPKWLCITAKKIFWSLCAEDQNVLRVCFWEANHLERFAWRRTSLSRRAPSCAKVARQLR